jgi:hypothetical protein
MDLQKVRALGLILTVLILCSCNPPIVNEYFVISVQPVNWRDQTHMPGPNAASFTGRYPDHILDQPGHRILGDPKPDLLALKVVWQSRIDLRVFIEEQNLDILFASSFFCKDGLTVRSIGPLWVSDRLGIVRRYTQAHDMKQGNELKSNYVYHTYLFVARKHQTAAGENLVLYNLSTRQEDVCIEVKLNSNLFGNSNSLIRVRWEMIRDAVAMAPNELPIIAH